MARKEFELVQRRNQQIAPMVNEGPVKKEEFDVFASLTPITLGNLLDRFNGGKRANQLDLKPGTLRTYRVGDFRQVNTTFEACEIVADSLDAAEIVILQLEKRGDKSSEEPLRGGKNWAEIVPLAKSLMPLSEATRPVVMGEVLVFPNALLFVEKIGEDGVAITAVIDSKVQDLIENSSREPLVETPLAASWGTIEEVMASLDEKAV